MEIKEKDILVSKWGYSMILSTWVRVVKVSPKTLLVEEIQERSLTSEELETRNLHPSYLQYYTVPTEKLAINGRNEISKRFRLYSWTLLPGESDSWKGKPDQMSSHLIFRKWDGRPEFEDHCD